MDVKNTRMRIEESWTIFRSRMANKCCDVVARSEYKVAFGYYVVTWKFGLTTVT